MRKYRYCKCSLYIKIEDIAVVVLLVGIFLVLMFNGCVTAKHSRPDEVVLIEGIGIAEANARNLEGYEHMGDHIWVEVLNSQTFKPDTLMLIQFKSLFLRHYENRVSVDTPEITSFARGIVLLRVIAYDVPERAMLFESLEPLGYKAVDYRMLIYPFRRIAERIEFEVVLIPR